MVKSKAKYVIVAYRKKKRLGKYRNHKGKIMVFSNKREAITTAHIESQQMEADGLTLKVRRLIKRR